MIPFVLTSSLCAFFAYIKYKQVSSDDDEQQSLLEPTTSDPSYSPKIKYLVALAFVAQSGLNISTLDPFLVLSGCISLLLASIVVVVSFKLHTAFCLLFGCLVLTVIHLVQYGIIIAIPSLVATVCMIYNVLFYPYHQHNAIPQDPTKKYTPSKELESTLFSRGTFKWLSPIISLGNHQSLTMNDVFDLNPQDKSKVNTELYNSIQEDNSSFSMLYTLFTTVKYEIGKQCLFGIIGAMLTFSGPFFLNKIIDYLQHKDLPFYIPLCYLLAMFLLAILKSMLDGQTYFLGRRVGTRVRGILISKLYEQALTCESGPSTGEIVNLMAVDTQKCLDYVCYLHMLITTPLQIIVCTIALYTFLGVSALCGIFLMIVIIPTQSILAKVVEKQQNSLLEVTDKRLTLINELLTSIKSIKLFGWQEYFFNNIQDTRATELKKLNTFLTTVAFMTVIYHAIPILVSITTFIVFTTLQHGQLTPTNVFTTLSLFYTLRMPLYDVPDQFVRYFETSVSVKRLQQFLSLSRPSPIPRGPLECNVVSHYPKSTAEFHFDLQFPKNSKLIIIIGATGSGKSTLLNTLLGQCTYTGTLSMPSVSYCPQSPWLINQSIQHNILFNLPLVQSVYELVIAKCQLQLDIQSMGGHFHLLSENGQGCSGGQKQRLCLARALYRLLYHQHIMSDVPHDSESMMLLLDDVLSAVDAPTQQLLFHQAILPLQSTTILVTHSLFTLHYADHIILMDNNQIKAQGQLKDIKEFIQLDQQQEQDKVSAASQQQVAHVPRQVMENDDEEQDSDEFQCQGSVKFQVYKVYCLASGGLFMWVLLLLGNALSQFLVVTQDVYLKQWTTSSMSSDSTSTDSTQLMLFYISIGLGSIVMQTLVMLLQFYASLKASHSLHYHALLSLINSPLSYFEQTPLGRIMNRFSRDIQIVDREMSTICSTYLFQWCGTLSILGLIIMIVPQTLLVCVPLTLLCYKMSLNYLNTSRELKRCDASTKSPLVAHFQSSIQGKWIIQSAETLVSCKNQLYSYLDVNHRAFFYLWVSNRWLQIRTDGIGAIVVMASGLSLLWMDMDPALSGLVLSYALTFTDSLMWLVRYNALVEMNLNAIERLVEYTELESESTGPPQIEEVPRAWPTKGYLQFTNVGVQINNTVLVHPTTLTIYPNEKIGLIGRTGAGKSTLINCCFRTLPFTGDLTIDQVNIKDIPLTTLRQSLTFIPQDPLLFKGSLRYNLDPMELYSDMECYQALKRVQLSLDLDTAIDQSSLSVGESQLIALARALLKHTKVIIMDEATANIDNQTDLLIQSTIRRECIDSTIICIAHRLQTIIDFNRIIVMDKGRVVEFDTPLALYKNKGIFYDMVQQSGSELVSKLLSQEGMNRIGSFTTTKSYQEQLNSFTE